MAKVFTVKEILDSLGGPFEIDDKTYQGSEVLGKARVRVSGIPYSEDNVIRLNDTEVDVVVGRQKYTFTHDDEGDRTDNAHKHLEDFGRTLKPKKRVNKK